eukprot:3192439-Amphidinium_carterae.1
MYNENCGCAFTTLTPPSTAPDLDTRQTAPPPKGTWPKNFNAGAPQHTTACLCTRIIKTSARGVEKLVCHIEQ